MRLQPKQVDAILSDDDLESDLRPKGRATLSRKRSPIAEAVESAHVTAIHSAGPLRNPVLDPTTEELRTLFQQMDAKLALAVVPETRLGDNSDTTDQSVALDAALAHGNPVSRYVQVFPKEEQTSELDYIEVHGERIHAPRRAVRMVLGKDKKGNFIFGWVPDTLIRTSIKYRIRESVLSFYPKEVLRMKNGLEVWRRSLKTRERFQTIHVYHNPMQKIAAESVLPGVEEADIVSTKVTSNLPGQYGVDNLREKEYYLLRALRRQQPTHMPQAMCTWLVGEDIQKLKKKRMNKTLGSAKARRDENRTSFAFPSIAMYQPPPKWWEFLRKTDGVLHPKDGVYPNGIMDSDLRRIVAHNQLMRAQEDEYWSVHANWYTWWFENCRQTEEQAPMIGPKALDPDSERSKREVPEPVLKPVPVEEPAELDHDPAPPKSLKATRAAKRAAKQARREEIRLAQALREESGQSDKGRKISTRTSRKLSAINAREQKRKAEGETARASVVEEQTADKPIEFIMAKARKQRDAIQMKILRQITTGWADVEETASQQSESEATSVLEGEYIAKSDYVPNFTIVPNTEEDPPPRVSDEMLKYATIETLRATATPKALGQPAKKFPVDIMVDGTPMFFDLEDPKSLQGIEYLMDSITKRVGDLAVMEDLLEEFRETALRLQGTLRDGEAYMKYNSLFSTSDIPMPKKQTLPRKMVAEDIGVFRVRPGVILYGHGRTRTKGVPTAGFSAWWRVCKTLALIEKSRKKSMSTGRLKRKAQYASIEQRRNNPRTPAEFRANQHRRDLKAHLELCSVLHAAIVEKLSAPSIVEAKARHERWVKAEKLRAARELRCTRQRREYVANHEKWAVERKRRGLMYLGRNTNPYDPVAYAAYIDKLAVRKAKRLLLLDKRITEIDKVLEVERMKERALLKIRRRLDQLRNLELKERRERSLFNRAKKQVQKVLDKFSKKAKPPVQEPSVPVMQTITAADVSEFLTPALYRPEENRAAPINHLVPKRYRLIDPSTQNVLELPRVSNG